MTDCEQKPKQKILRRVAQADPDVVCYTEAIQSALPPGFTIEPSADYGYSNTGLRRKVVLWSKHPWTTVDESGYSGMPSGRFISGVSGGIRFVGVCIPWRDAHVDTGRQDRSRWEEHLSYCRGLGKILEQYSRSAAPICVLGDFNQQIPRGTQPKHVYMSLLGAIPERFTISTFGMDDSEGKRLIDHFVVCPRLTAEAVEILPRISPDGTRLSDHAGILTALRVNRATQGG